MSNSNSNQEQYQIAEQFVIEDLETLRVVADPLRLRILEAFGERPVTVKQIARTLDIPPNKLYYHVNMLEEHGLIRVVDTRIVSGIIEKIYLITAHHITPAKGLLSPGGVAADENWQMVVDSVFDDSRQRLMESVRAGLVDVTKENTEHSSFNLGAANIELTSEQAKELNSRLEALLKEFVALKHDDRRDLKVYRLFATFFPMNRAVDPPEDEPED